MRKTGMSEQVRNTLHAEARTWTAGELAAHLGYTRKQMQNALVRMFRNGQVERAKGASPWSVYEYWQPGDPPPLRDIQGSPPDIARAWAGSRAKRAARRAAKRAVAGKLAVRTTARPVPGGALAGVSAGVVRVSAINGRTLATPTPVMVGHLDHALLEAPNRLVISTPRAELVITGPEALVAWDLLTAADRLAQATAAYWRMAEDRELVQQRHDELAQRLRRAEESHAVLLAANADLVRRNEDLISRPAGPALDFARLQSVMDRMASVLEEDDGRS